MTVSCILEAVLGRMRVSILNVVLERVGLTFWKSCYWEGSGIPDVVLMGEELMMDRPSGCRQRT